MCRIIHNFNDLVKIYIVIIIISLLFATTCTDKTNNRECVIYRTNIDLSHQSFTHLLSDESNHYLFGELEKDIRDFRTNEITIDQAKVGEEKNWASFSKNIPGECQAVCQTKRNIYLISRQQYQERQDPKYSKHKLYKISKEGGGIVELYEWDKGNSFVRDVFFESDEKRGFVFFDPSGNPLDYQILSTVDGGKKWDVKDLKKPVLVPQFDSKNIYFLSYKRNKADWIYSIDKTTGALDSLQFDLKITYFVVGDNNDYWLLGKDGDKTVLKYYQDGKGTHIKTFSDHPEFFPERVYKYNDLIVVLAGKIDHNMLLGFGGTRPKMYLSKDRGLTWTEQSLKEALYLGPVSFYKDERITAYAGLGKVLSCSLEK